MRSFEIYGKVVDPMPNQATKQTGAGVRYIYSIARAQLPSMLINSLAFGLWCQQ